MSDQDTSIFGNQNSQETPAQTNTSGVSPTQPNDELATLLVSIKNERGEQKYRTVQDALKALGHSQEYIPELSQKLKQQEQELAEARAAAAKVAELERVVQSLTEAKPHTETPSQSGLSEEQVAAQVVRILSEQGKKKVAEDNVATVVNTVKKVYGDKAESVFYGRAQELGMTVDQFNSLAASTPKAVLKLLGLEDKAVMPSQSPTQTFNTTGLEPRKDTFVGRNSQAVQVGATSNELINETRNAKKMVDELHAQGKSVHDLTSWAEYQKYFGKQ